MGVDNPGKGTDLDAENVETPPVRDKAWRPPPDNPGSPGQPSRLESLRAAAARFETMNEQDNEQGSAVEEKPGVTSEEAADSDTETDGRTASAAPAEKNADETEDLTVGDQSSPEQLTGRDDDESGEAPAAGATRPEFVGTSANELDSPQLGPRRASKEAAIRNHEAESAEVKGESSGLDEEPTETQKTTPGTGTVESVERSDASELGDEGDEQGQSGLEAADQGDAWRDHVDSMRAKWVGLKVELTPDRPPEGTDQVDPRSESADEVPEELSDEPGSWRGDTGRYLNHEENYAVGRVFERVNDREADVTDGLKLREAEVPDVELVGLEYRLKGEERFKDKAAENLAAELRRDSAEAAESISDALRYTYQIPADSYVQGYQRIADGLRESGNKMVFCGNS